MAFRLDLYLIFTGPPGPPLRLTGPLFDDVFWACTGPVLRLYWPCTERCWTSIGLPVGPLLGSFLDFQWASTALDYLTDLLGVAARV